MSYYKSQSYNECTPKCNHCGNHSVHKYRRDDCYNDYSPLCPPPSPPPCPPPCPQPCPPPCPQPCPPPPRPCPPIIPPMTPPPTTCSYFLAATTALTLTTTATPLPFIPQKQTPGITGISPTLTFNQTGSFLVQVRVPVTTNSSYTGTGSLFISPVTSGSISVVPSDFISSVLTPGLNNVQQTYFVIATVTAPGATLSFNTGLNAVPTSGFPVLGSGYIIAYKLS